MIAMSRAASATVRVSGPRWSSDHDSGIAPARLTRPYVGLRPTTPQQAAGSLIEPPVSLPSAPSANPAATAAAEPLDEPPAPGPGNPGFWPAPWGALPPNGPRAAPVMLGFPSARAPAPRSRFPP